MQKRLFILFFAISTLFSLCGCKIIDETKPESLQPTMLQDGDGFDNEKEAPDVDIIPSDDPASNFELNGLNSSEKSGEKDSWIQDSITYSHIQLEVSCPDNWTIRKSRATVESPDAWIIISTDDSEPPLLEMIITNSALPISEKKPLEPFVNNYGVKGNIFVNNMFLPSGHNGETIVFETQTEFVCANITLSHPDYLKNENTIFEILNSIRIINL